MIGTATVVDFRGEQQLGETEKALLEEVYSRLDAFEQDCREYHDIAREARKILRLKDPNLPKKVLQMQTLKSAFNTCVADMMQNMPEARILPEAPNGEELAVDLQDVVRHIIYDINDYEQVHRRRAEDMYCTGTSIVQIAWDQDMNNGKGDIGIFRWPIEAFLWDPKAENIQDARALIKVSWHPLSWYSDHYPDTAQYINAEDNSHNQVGQSDITKATQNDEGLAMLIEYWYRRYDAKTRKYTINVAYCAGGALIDHYEDVYKHGMYPFVVDAHSTIEGVPVGDGMIMELSPMMRYINRYADYIDTNLRMASKGRMLVRKNSGVDKSAMADWSTDIIEGDSIRIGEDWSWLQHAPLSGNIAGQMMQLQTDLKQDSGANQYSASSGITAAKSIVALQEAGGKITLLRTDTLNIGFKKIVEQVLWLMAEMYDHNRMVMITGKTGQQRQVDAGMMNGNIPPAYMVQIEINRKNPLRVEAMNETFMQAYTMASQAKQFFPLSSLFQMLNIDGKDRLLPVIQQNENYQQQMEQMQQQVEQMQQQLAQVSKENETLKQTSTQMANSFSNVSKATGGGYVQGQNQRLKVARQGGGQGTQSDLVNQVRKNL